MSNDNPNDLRDVQPTVSGHIIGQAHVKKALQIAVEASFQEKKRPGRNPALLATGFGEKARWSQFWRGECAVPFKEILAQSITNAAELNGHAAGSIGRDFVP